MTHNFSLLNHTLAANNHDHQNLAVPVSVSYKHLDLLSNILSATGRQGYGMLRNMTVCYGWLRGLAD